jgi:hypothetical protein
MKPYDIFFRKEKYSLKLYKHWFDEFGNSLHIKTKTRGKHIEIIYNDLSLKEKSILCTDFYFGLPIAKIARISSLLHLFIGKDDDENKMIIISFLGIDGFFRSYIYTDEGWKRVPTIMLGVNILRGIARNIDIQYFIELKEYKIIPSFLLKEVEYLSRLSSNDGQYKNQKVFVEMVRQKHTINLEFLLEKDK